MKTPVRLRFLGLASLLFLTGGKGGGAVADPGSGAWHEEDWRIFAAKVRWGVAQRLDSIPIGPAIAAMGRTFVGATYLPGTLEVPGPERLVVNLRAVDCVTFVENVLALVRFVRHDGIAGLDDRPTAAARYEGYLRDLRYRGGVLDGYPSRLHYFSEWLADNERRGRLRQLSSELGGRVDEEPIDFMSTHPDAYRQLADPDAAAAIRAVESRLGAVPRYVVPEDRIRGVEDRIEDGDIIAATSTVAGLDIAHTGFALRQDGRVYLLHAPLVGKVVEISAVPLAERILGIKAQDGVMVGRPVELPVSARVPTRRR